MKPLSLALMVGCLLAIECSAQTADSIYHGGTILTMAESQPVVGAVAVRDGKIIATGSKQAVLSTRGETTRLIDLKGQTMLPGFVDAHGHVMGGGLQALSANVLSPPDGPATDIATLKRTVKEWMDANKTAVEKIKLVIGFGYDNAQLTELRHPNRKDLDGITNDIPIVLIHQSGHIIACNSAALDAGGINADSPNPEGGVIQRFAGGQEPNGVLEETAAFPLLIKLLGRIGPENAEVFIDAGAKLWASFGYTTAQDGRTMPGALKTLRSFADAGNLKIDIVSYPDILVNRDIIKQQASRTYKNRLRVGGAKLTVDGSPQGFTAWRDRPYYKPVGNYPPGYVGYAAASAEQVGDAIDWAYENGIQILTHSNGEAASDQLISFIDAAQLKHKAKEIRPVLIHGQFLREDQIDSLKRLGVLPSLFPMHTFYWGDWHREHTVGPKLADNISPTGWCVRRGMKFTTHHDAPVALPDSMRVLDATVTRRSRSGDIVGPDQRVDVMTALKAMTIWPAWQHFEEHRKGTIELGKLADFVILDLNPLEVDPETLDQISVTATIKEGVKIYGIAEFGQLPNTKSRVAQNANTRAFTNALVALNNSAQTQRTNANSPEQKTIVPPCPTCVCGLLSNLVDIASTAPTAE